MSVLLKTCKRTILTFRLCRATPTCCCARRTKPRWCWMRRTCRPSHRRRTWVFYFMHNFFYINCAVVWYVVVTYLFDGVFFHLSIIFTLSLSALLFSYLGALSASLLRVARSGAVEGRHLWAQLQRARLGEPGSPQCYSVRGCDHSQRPAQPVCWKKCFVSSLFYLRILIWA